MKKIMFLILMALVGVSLIFKSVQADEARTIKHKTYTTTTNAANGQATVVSTKGVTIFKISGYASATNAMWAIFDSDTYVGVGTTATGTYTDAKMEGGKATQYDLILVDFGSTPLRLDTGLTVYSYGAALSFEYD